MPAGLRLLVAVVTNIKPTTCLYDSIKVAFELRTRRHHLGLEYKSQRINSQRVFRYQIYIMTTLYSDRMLSEASILRSNVAYLSKQRNAQQKYKERFYGQNDVVAP